MNTKQSKQNLHQAYQSKLKLSDIVYKGFKKKKVEQMTKSIDHEERLAKLMKIPSTAKFDRKVMDINDRFD